MGLITVDRTELSLEETIKTDKTGGNERNLQLMPENSGQSSEDNYKSRKKHDIKGSCKNKFAGICGVSKPKNKVFGDFTKMKHKWIISTEEAKLVISNLNYSVTDCEIRKLFSEFEMLISANVNYDKSGRSLGTANVSFGSKADAIHAVRKYDGVALDGRILKIQLTTSQVKSYEPVEINHCKVANKHSANCSKGFTGSESTKHKIIRHFNCGDHRGGNLPHLTAEQQLYAELDKMIDSMKSKVKSRSQEN